MATGVDDDDSEQLFNILGESWNALVALTDSGPI